MEVLISAAVLVLVVFGALAAIDAVTSTAGANKARTVAAALAEKNQERLRGLRTAELNTLNSLIPAPETVEVDHLKYTVTSDADWVSDKAGANVSCALSTGEGSYLRIQSTVTSSAAGVRPVVMTSIVAPQPGSGTLTAIVKNANDQPVASMPVSAVGPTKTLTVTTDADGCAVFGAVDSGAWEIRLDQTGWVGPDGNQLQTKSATVAAGTLTTVEMLYDKLAQVTVKVDTIKQPGGTSPTADVFTGIMAAHSSMQTGFKTAPDTNAVAVPGTVPAEYSQANFTLFPFKTAYKFYAGRCIGADPSKYVTSYFTTNPLAAPILTSGSNPTITVREPSVNLLIKRGTSVRSGAYVWAYPQATDCADEPIRLGPTDSNGLLPNPGLPFGDYKFCATYTTSGSTYSVTSSTVFQNRSAGGMLTATTLTIPTSGTSSCPATL